VRTFFSIPEVWIVLAGVIILAVAAWVDRTMRGYDDED
jgi:hypothetical protein